MTRSYWLMETINGETITGIALIFLATLFIYASSVNQVWALILPADFLILVIGGGFVALGVMTMTETDIKPHVRAYTTQKSVYTIRL